MPGSYDRAAHRPRNRAAPRSGEPDRTGTYAALVRLRVVDGCPVCAEDAEFIRTTSRPDYEAPRSKVRVVDLFSGGGGLTLGFAEAAKRVGRGIKIVLAVELDLGAADVFELNFPRVKLTRRRVEALFPGAPGKSASVTSPARSPSSRVFPRSAPYPKAIFA